MDACIVILAFIPAQADLERWDIQGQGVELQAIVAANDPGGALCDHAEQRCGGQYFLQRINIGRLGDDFALQP